MLTNFPNGILATPNLGGGNEYAGLFGTGVLFVDGVLGGDGNDGSSEAPLATIQKAINNSSAYGTIYVRPKYPLQGVNQGQPNVYAENLTIPITLTGLKIIGVADARDPYFGPKIKPANTAANVITVNASGVVLENLCIMNQPLSTAGVFLSWMGSTYNQTPTVDASHVLYAGSCGAQIRNCEFREGTTMATGGASIVIRGGYQSTIEGCTFIAGANAQAIQYGDDISPSRGHKIINCDFMDYNGAVATNYITFGTGLHAGCLVKNSTFGKATNFITVKTGATGIIANCQFDDLVATLANSTGKVTVPIGTMSVVGCTGGIGLVVVQSQA